MTKKDDNSQIREEDLHIRLLTVILLGHAGFMWFNEISELKCKDIEFKKDYVILKLRKSKTDIYRSGKVVLISKVSSSACPQSRLHKDSF